MLQTPVPTDVATLPLAPKNPLPYRDQLRAVRSLIDGHQELLDAGGPVTRIVLGPKWLFPTAVLIASPQGARDVLGRTDEIADRGGTTTAIQLRRLMGGNLLVLPHHEWLPRRRTLQPMFTKQRIPRYAGHMAAAAQSRGRRLARRCHSRSGHRMPHPYFAGARPVCARHGPRRPGRCHRAGIATRCFLDRGPRDPARESAAMGAHPRPAAGP